jgi:hypothetical protein
MARAAGLHIVSTPPDIKVGDEFHSPDGCNGCGCTERGFECTHNRCTYPLDDSNCPSNTMSCPDGTLYGPFGPNCLIRPSCDRRMRGCFADLMTCPNGTYVGRGPPYCTFAPCP